MIARSALRLALALCGALALALAHGTAQGTAADCKAATASRDLIVSFDASAFPYDGEIPGQAVRFLDTSRDGRRGHTAPRFGVYWEDQTYSDRSVLLSVPERIDWGRPVTLVVYFHGNEARLRRDVIDRQGVARQVHAAGLNAILIAPQLAVDALDSSAGHFWEPGFFARFLGEAAERIAGVAGDKRAADQLGAARVVVVAYSGGYLPAAFVLERGGADGRIAGVILLDAVYAEEERFAGWIARRRGGFFFSAASPSTRPSNLLLQRLLTARGVAFRQGLPSRLDDGGVAFLATPDQVDHATFLTRAWVDQPLRAVLSRLSGARALPRGACAP